MSKVRVFRVKFHLSNRLFSLSHYRHILRETVAESCFGKA